MSVETEKKVKVRPLLCTVTSDRMDKSRVGVVERLVKHARYDKYRKRTTKVMFHDEANSTNVGDKVLVTPSRPFSAHKRFRLVKVVKKAAE